MRAAATEAGSKYSGHPKVTEHAPDWGWRPLPATSWSRLAFQPSARTVQAFRLVRGAFYRQKTKTVCLDRLTARSTATE